MNMYAYRGEGFTSSERVLDEDIAFSLLSTNCNCYVKEEI